jgi:hypothetical protein
MTRDSAALLASVANVAELLPDGQRVRSFANVMTGGTDIDLGRVERGMAEKCLDNVDGLSAIDELHGDGVAERVGCGPIGEGR